MSNNPTILVDRVALTAGLAFLDREIVERRNTIPILSGVLFEPIGDDPDGVPVAIAGTDLDMLARLELPASLFTNPRPFVAANAKALHDAVKACTTDEVTLELTDAGLKVSGGGVNMTLATLPATDFPRIASGEAVARWQWDGVQLAEDLARVSIAISTEETRYYLNGIYMHPADAPLMEDKTFGPPRALTFAATDGHRLCMQRRPIPEGAETAPGVIQPRKLISALRKLLGKPKPLPKSAAGILAAGRAGKLTPDVGVALNDSKVQLQIGRWTVTSKLIDGTFPDYTRVVPSANSNALQMNALAMATAADSAKKVSGDKSPAVHLEIGEAETVFSCISPENGVGRATAPGALRPISTCLNGDDGINRPVVADDADPITAEVGFNAGYLADVCRTFGDVTVTLSIEDAMAPVLFTAPDVPGYLAVLMPYRTGAPAEYEASKAKANEPRPEPAETASARFIRIYSASWANRDTAGMERAVREFREAGLVAPTPECEVIGRLTIASMAADCRVDQEDDDAVRGERQLAARRIRLQLTAAELTARGFVTNGMSGTRSPGSFSRLNDAVKAVAQLATLTGFDRADPRAVLPIAIANGETGLVRASDLHAIGKPCLSLTDAKGEPMRRRKGSNMVWRYQIEAVLPPKLDATETARRLIRAEADNVALRARLDVLESMVADISAARQNLSPPAPEPEIVVVAAPAEPEPVAVQPDPEPTIMGAIIADLATRLQEAERLLAGRATSRARTASALRAMRAKVRLATAEAATARDAVRTAEGDAADATERNVTLAGRLHDAETQLARLAPLAAAIAGLTQPAPAQPPAEPAQPLPVVALAA